MADRNDGVLVDRALIGMIHVQALPGSPKHDLSVDEIVVRAAVEARLLLAAGFDALLIENMHDAPYLMREVGPEVVSAMTAVALAVREAAGEGTPVGIQILAGANMAALAVAQAAGLQFVRAEGFVFASVADEGLMAEADAGRLLRYRKMIGAEDVRIFADIKKKHSSHAITADVSLAETAQAAEFFGADGVIVTGGATGQATALADVQEAAGAVKLPVLVGSGVTPESAPGLLDHADALIVGSYLKHDGVWSNPIDPERARAVVESVK